MHKVHAMTARLWEENSVFFNLTMKFFFNMSIFPARREGGQNGSRLCFEGKLLFRAMPPNVRMCRSVIRIDLPMAQKYRHDGYPLRSAAA